ncbi:hypothetical protein PC9H_003128 [Pleurotus ostreatus]|uniref:Uncharacterized protein n=1 Tax=Pleurotus ostreatus TaxID=5322 RepID=A0A8H7A0B0_PLEOS|nr:uncharacterized protein PC9H_003128 [Pleurotus ostreatus]KAF7436299.1 hypothetical protein PC9H_003128 [Pleurotus ostreatus]
MAQTLVDDVEPRDYLAFWMNPKAEGHMIGFCYMRMPYKEARVLENYTKSAGSFPEDDEKRVYFLTLALEALWGREGPVKETLPVAEKAKKSIPKMKRSWEHSAMSKRRHASITLMLQFEKQVREGDQFWANDHGFLRKAQMP